MSLHDSNPEHSRRDTVYVFRIGQFGDTIVTLPAMRRIAELHPNAQLIVITNAPTQRSFVTAWDVLKHTQIFSGALFYDASRIDGMLSLALSCRRAQPATLYYLAPVRSAWQRRRDDFFFRYLCGFKDIRGRTRTLTRSALRRRSQILPRECDRLLALVDPSGKAPKPPYLLPNDAARSRAAELLQPLGSRPLIAVAPGSKMPAKRWFLDRYLELCRRLLDQYPELGIVLFGGKEERAEAETLVTKLGTSRILNLAGHTDIIESAAALAHCRLYVGNDTGTMHLAAIMGVRCVAIFTSREARDVWCPWGDSHTILRRELPCSGCMLERCEQQKMRCLDLITVDDVFTSARSQLDALLESDSAVPERALERRVR